MHITLRPGEKLYLNGAVLRTDRKVSLELLNDATFLLEAHVMHVDRATTPVRQLYFIVQMMLMNPLDTRASQSLFGETVSLMLSAYEDRIIRQAIEQTSHLVVDARYFEALKMLRAVFERDDVLTAGTPTAIAS